MSVKFKSNDKIHLQNIIDDHVKILYFNQLITLEPISRIDLRKCRRKCVSEDRVIFELSTTQTLRA